MKKQRPQQIIFSLMIALSLFASTLAACGCAHHHAENAGADTSCHDRMTMPMATDEHAENSAGDVQNALAGNEHCNCASPAPKVFSKSTIVNIEKQSAEILMPETISFQAISRVVPNEKISVAQLFYLSDSSYNIKSPRAPPQS